MPGAPALEFFRLLGAFEHAWWSVVSSKYDGNLLDYLMVRQKGVILLRSLKDARLRKATKARKAAV
jgi:hypothetical protein